MASLGHSQLCIPFMRTALLTLACCSCAFPTQGPLGPRSGVELYLRRARQECGRVSALQACRDPKQIFGKRAHLRTGT
jgi:hypothetical protein